MSTRRYKRKNALSILDEVTGGPLTISECLAAIRVGEDLNHTQFAQKLGISKSHLCDLEKGRKAVSLARAIEFAEILGYSKDQFARLALQALVDKAQLPYKVLIKAA